LAEHFLRHFCADHGKPEAPFAAETLETMMRYAWPGNVRQLKNVIESMVVFHPGGEIKPAALPSEIRESSSASSAHAPVQPQIGTPRAMDEIERQAILETLRRTGGHRAEAAKMLQIGLRTLQRKLKDYRDQGYTHD
jgi:DNA-binding NtrC family response regulator